MARYYAQAFGMIGAMLLLIIIGTILLRWLGSLVCSSDPTLGAFMIVAVFFILFLVIALPVWLAHDLRAADRDRKAARGRE